MRKSWITRGIHLGGRRRAKRGEKNGRNLSDNVFPKEDDDNGRAARASVATGQKKAWIKGNLLALIIYLP